MKKETSADDTIIYESGLRSISEFQLLTLERRELNEAGTHTPDVCPHDYH